MKKSLHPHMKNRFTLNRVAAVVIFYQMAIASISSQGVNPDSLWNSWRNTALPDTSRLNALPAIYNYEKDINADSAIQAANSKNHKVALLTKVVELSVKRTEEPLTSPKTMNGYPFILYFRPFTRLIEAFIFK